MPNAFAAGGTDDRVANGRYLIVTFNKCWGSWGSSVRLVESLLLE